MRRVFFLLAAMILAGAAATAAARARAPAGVGAEAGPAKLLLVDSGPVVLRGIGFKSSERVRVMVDAGRQDVTRTAIASTTGRFTMRVAGVDANACTSFAATAVGDKGSRATFKRAPGQCALP